MLKNSLIEELEQLSRIGSSETATRCTAIQMLLAGISRELVRDQVLGLPFVRFQK